MLGEPVDGFWHLNGSGRNEERGWQCYTTDGLQVGMPMEPEDGFKDGFTDGLM